MLEALSFIPCSITEACHIIRAIRNDFAHNLEHTRLSQIEKKNVRKMEALLKRVTFLSPLTGELGVAANFKNLSLLAITGLEFYVDNLVRLRNRISNEEFLIALETEARKDLARKFQESRDRGVKGVSRNGTKWAVQYDTFTEIVDELPAGVEPPPSEA